MSVFQAMRGLANVPWFFAFGGTDHVGQSETRVTVTSSSTIHTKGAWSQLVASTADESSLLYILVDSVSTPATETSLLLDIGVGAAGSETAIASNIAVGGANSGTGILGIVIPLPVKIASGSRISARCQSLIASKTCGVRYGLFKLPAAQVLPTSVDVIGTSTATSRGTALSGSSGSWVEISASISQRYRAVFLVPSSIGTDNANIVGTKLSIGVGASGSEVTIGSQFVTFNAAESVYAAPAIPQLPIACDIPAGSRIAVKHNIASNPGNYGVCLIGIP